MNFTVRTINKGKIIIDNGNFTFDENAYIVDDMFLYYHTMPDDNELFDEQDIINKINLNEEGFFDFSKDIIDGGARQGEYSIMTNFNHAYAFEPELKQYYLMCANIALHDKEDKVTPYQCGIGDKHEIVNFNGFNVEGTVEFCNIGHPYNKQIEIKNIDSFDFNNVGLIKIDVEGYEYKALLGSIGTIIRNNYPPILFEHGSDTPDSNDIHIMENNGYEIIWQWGNPYTHLAIHKN